MDGKTGKKKEEAGQEKSCRPSIMKKSLIALALYMI